MGTYESLATDESETFLSRDPQDSNGKNNVSRTRTWLLRVSLLLNFILIVFALFLPLRVARGSRSECPVTTVYSPAEDAVQYQPHLFDHSNPEIRPTKYQGKGPEVDQAWQDLYGASVTVISEDEAAKFTNWTQPIEVGGEQIYSTQLSVFHSLHCLNLARMSLYPDYYNSTRMRQMLTPDHLSHCIDAVRQSVQCSADITPMPGRYSTLPERPLIEYWLHTTHMCRDFGKIQEWAEKRQVSAAFVKVATDAIVEQ